MKCAKALLTALIVISIHGSVSGQAAIIAILFGDKVASENFNISMEVGGAYANFSDLDNVDWAKFGLNFGIAGNARLSKNFFVSPGIYFLARRNMLISSFNLNTGTPELDQQFQNVSGELSLSYIDIPILLSYQTNNKKFRFSLAPQISILQDADAIYKGESGDFHSNLRSDLESVDYGGMIDIAYVLGKAHKGRGIFIHARYYQGFTDVIKTSVSPSNNQISFFSFHLSLPFITDELAEKNLKEFE